MPRLTNQFVLSNSKMVLSIYMSSKNMWDVIFRCFKLFLKALLLNIGVTLQSKCKDYP